MDQNPSKSINIDQINKDQPFAGGEGGDPHARTGFGRDPLDRRCIGVLPGITSAKSKGASMTLGTGGSFRPAAGSPRGKASKCHPSVEICRFLFPSGTIAENNNDRNSGRSSLTFRRIRSLRRGVRQQWVLVHRVIGRSFESRTVASISMAGRTRIFPLESILAAQPRIGIVEYVGWPQNLQCCSGRPRASPFYSHPYPMRM